MGFSKRIEFQSEKSGLQSNYYRLVKKNLSVILLLFIVCNAFAEVPPDYRYMKMWRVNQRFGEVDSMKVDTTHLNFQTLNPIDQFSIANSYNGNVGSPIQSKLYFDRPEYSDFIFATAYSPYMMNVDHASFYNTKTPFSRLFYTSGGSAYRKRDDFNFLFTANANKRFNAGVRLGYMNSIGEFAYQASNKFTGTLFGTYTGKHYSFVANASVNRMKNQENGGIASMDAYINNGWKASDLSPNLKAQSNYVENQVFFNHQYSIGIERPFKVSDDSVRLDYIPVTIFSHTFRYDDQRKRYYENSVNTSFYDYTYGAGSTTRDSSSLQTLTNNFSISMAEEFNKWANFGLKAFVENEVQRYYFLKDNMYNVQFDINTRVGGVLSKQRGQRFRYNVLGELTLTGYKAGNVRFDGNMGGYFRLWNDSIVLMANGFVRSDKPSRFLQYYESNHFRWNNDFGFVYRTHVGGTFSVPTRSLSLNVSLENVTNMIYFDSLGLPRQNGGNVQLLAFNLKKDFHVGKFTLENNVVYQVSSDSYVTPLPAFTLYHNLYYDDLWFGVLSVQLGASVRYHSSYYAPAYMPATGQFYAQEKTKVGNYPLANAYVNCHLKRVRFYIEYYNIYNLMKKGHYYIMPSYPVTPAIIQTGISWNFYD